jgi:hypothetical protein
MFKKNINYRFEILIMYKNNLQCETCFLTICDELLIFFASRDYIENLNDVFSWCCFLYFLKLNEKFEIHNLYKIHKNVQNICSLFRVTQFKIHFFSFNCFIQTCCVSFVSFRCFVFKKCFRQIIFENSISFSKWI